MVEYLNASNRVLSDYTSEAIATMFVPRSESGVVDPLPWYAGAGMHSWHAPVYNPGSPHVSRIAGRIAETLYVGGDCEVVTIGDSKTEQYGVGAGRRWDLSWPGQLRSDLEAVEGAIVVATAGFDNRWTTTNLQLGTSAQLGLFPTTDGDPWTASLNLDTPHTGGAFWVHSIAGGSGTITVDDGTPQPFTIPTGNGFHAITPDVSGTGPHRYVIASSSPAVNLAIFRPAYAGPRLKITNLGRSGATALYWQPGYSSTQAGLWDVLATCVDPSVIFCQLGTNQPSQNGPANAVNLGILYTAINALDLPTLIMAPGGLTLDGPESYNEMYAAQWTAADAHNWPLLDVCSVIGDFDTADDLGLMFNNPHENAFGAAWVSRAVRSLIGGTR